MSYSTNIHFLAWISNEILRREAAELRWKAASAAGVNLIATDQFEDLAATLKTLQNK